MGAKQKRKEGRYILEDLCFCDLMNDTCREGAGKTKQDLEMSHLSGSWTTGDNGIKELGGSEADSFHL